MTILIVDDNPTNLTLIDKILQQEGYRDTRTLESAIELFEYLNETTSQQQIPGDLILMDLMMPDIDGIEACRIIQKVDMLKDIPIIIVTAYGESLKLAEALDAGAVDFVTKPINKIELLARIRVALRLKREKDLHNERDRKIMYELDLAKQVQQSVLKEPFENKQMMIETVYHPSFELAGDMYAWYPLDEQRYAVILLDVMGHGISSSLVGMYIYSVLRDIIHRELEPERVVKELNAHMNRLNSSETMMLYYCTAIYLVIDTAAKTVEYVNAGHPPGLLFEPEETQPIYLDKGTCALGMAEKIKIEKGLLRYERDSSLYLYTDGVMEMFDDEQSDGLQPLAADIQQHRGLSLKEYVKRMLPEHADDQKDDICMLRIHLKE